MGINATARSGNTQNEAIVRSQGEIRLEIIYLFSTYVLSLLFNFCSIGYSWYELVGQTVYLYTNCIEFHNYNYIIISQSHYSTI